MTTTEGKPKRLRPWLEGLLKRGDIAGLQWHDEQRTMFRITWKHHGKQDWSLEDGRVFMVSVFKIIGVCLCCGVAFCFEFICRAHYHSFLIF